MRILEVCEATGLSRDTIRFYERQGLLGPVVRTANGYRDYDERAVAVVKFIKRYQALGFSLQEIGKRARSADQLTFAEIQSLVGTKIRETEGKISELRSSVTELRHVLAECASTRS